MRRIDFQWAVGSQQWAVGSGQWAVGSGQWAVGSWQSAIGSYYRGGEPFIPRFMWNITLDVLWKTKL